MNTPWTPVPAGPGQRKGHGLLWAVVVLVLLAAAGVVIWLLTRADDEPGADNSTGDDGSTAAEAAYADLPRAGALPDATLVVPRDVGGNIDLYLVDSTDGTTTGQLTGDSEDEFGPLLGPDRDTVVYIRRSEAGDELWVVSTSGAGHRPLFPSTVEACGAPSRPAWNPADPTQLVIACNDDPAATALEVVALDGTVERTLETGFARVDDLAFSPDGTTVAFWAGGAGASSGDIYTQSVDGSSGPQQVTEGGKDTDVVWSSTGRLAVSRGFAEGDRRIVVMEVDGSNASPVTEGFVDQGPVWAPDGAFVAFKSNRPGAADVAGDHYWVVAVDGGDPRAIDSEGVVFSTAAWGHR